MSDLRGLASAIVLALFVALPARAEEVALSQALAERTLGRADAPITIIEYASMTCPHCAQFDRDTLPRLKATYIDTGKVKLIYRDFPLDGAALRAAALARCAPPERYFPLLDVLFQQQDVLSRAKGDKEQLDVLEKLGRQAGMRKETIDACLNSNELLDGIAAMRLRGETEFKIDGTPAFIIGQQKFNGRPSFEELEEALKPLLPGD